MLAYLDTAIAFAVVMLGVSLLITILNQVISSLIAHRGGNLAWGLKVLFGQISPGPAGLPIVASQAQNLAELVLTHPLASDSMFSTGWPAYLVASFPKLLRLVRRWQLASGIHPDELVAILRHIAANRPGTVPVGLHAMLAAEIGQLLAQPNPLAQRQGALANVLAPTVPAALVDKAVAVAHSAVGNLEAWFGTMMSRVSQRFAMWMRIWTVVFSFAIAGFFCLDAFDLLSNFYKNADLRARLVGSASQVSDIAKQIIPPGAKTTDEAVAQDTTRMFTSALNKAVKDSGASAPSAAGIASSADASKWIAANIQEAQRTDVEARLDQNLRAQMAEKVDAARKVTAMLTASKLPDVGPGNWTWDNWPGHLLGVLVSGLLLSLGAPFWFNTLNSLTSLRPQLAKQAQTPKAK